MAYDKVIDSAFLDGQLIRIADAIRKKTGKTDTLTLDLMVSEIGGIETAVLQEKTVAPTSQVQVIAPDVGYNGLSSVTVEAAASGGGLTDAVLYELPASVHFDGVSDYIDTGIQLMKEPCDFCILMDFVSENKGTLFHCMHEVSPYPGIAMQCTDSYTAYVDNWTVGYFDATRYLSASPLSADRYRVAISGTGRNIYWIKVYNVTSGSAISTGVIRTYTDVWSTLDETLLIGAYQSASGEKGRFWCGSLYDFKIIKRTMGPYELDAYLQTGALDYQ